MTENDPVGDYIPKQISRANLFAYIESELKSADSRRWLHPGKMNMPVPTRPLHERCWPGCISMPIRPLGAGNDRYQDAITYANKVINAGYSLMPTYRNLFTSDNNVNNSEVPSYRYLMMRPMPRIMAGHS